MVIVIQDAVLSSQFSGSIDFHWDCPIASDFSVVFPFSVDSNDTKSLLYQNHVHIYIKHIS